MKALEVKLLEVELLEVELLEVKLLEVGLLVKLLALEALEALEAEMLVGLVVQLESHRERWRKLREGFHPVDWVGWSCCSNCLLCWPSSLVVLRVLDVRFLLHIGFLQLSGARLLGFGVQAWVPGCGAVGFGARL